MAKKKLATCKGCGSSEALYVTLGNGNKLPSYVMKIGEGIFCYECASKGEDKPIDKCKTCPEQIDRNEHDCDYCEDCCHDLQMSWQVAE